ncbi:autotransporter domain-containing protein [Agrobacterium tumefaciens]|uniref:Autotransporter domain-containing protein n=1 Tax=Agrobacterium tumefaciens TaxID=358 RepID=A0A4D7YVC2_AGRTU|nr:autotransporter domain-containing protein [Agrobacterium tumefaciens]QCL97846.1 autotransporter domain-containing protein [Agrobacterium tumefaciens]
MPAFWKAAPLRDGMRRFLPVVVLIAVISIMSAVTALAQVPVINRQPIPAYVPEGRDAVFSIDVQDTGTSVQWQKSNNSNGPFSDVINGNRTELHLLNVALSDSGTYYRAAATLTGNTVYSAPASLTVVPADAPKVQTVAVPPAGYYRAGQTLSFQVQMDQTVSVTGIPAIQVVIGATGREAAYRSGSGSSVLTFSYTIQSGDMDMDGIALGSYIALNGGTIANSVGVPAELALNSVPPTSQIVVSTSSPTVILSTFSSPDHSIRRITVTFSEAVTGLTQSDFSLTPTGSATGSVTGLRTDDNITYDILVFYTSGAGSFSLHLPANAAVNAGGNGNVASNTLTWQVGSSVNADLQDIRPSSGILTPAFSASMTSYVVSVGNDVERISLTAVLANAAATMTLNGAPVEDGIPSSAIPLAVGNNAANITVTAQDGVSTNTYRVNIVREQSGSAGLVALVTSVGRLEPAFSPDTANYTLTLPFGIATLQLMPTAGDPSAAITINGNTTASGNLSRPIELTVGINDISVLVTAQNGTARSYIISVKREEPVFPDPTIDADVVGLLNAQTSTAGRFAQVQIRNFQNRLEQLHDEDERRKSSFGIRFGERLNNSPVESEPNLDGTGVTTFGYAIENSPALSGEVASRKKYPFPEQAVEDGPFAVWTDGFVNFGGRDNGKLDLDYTLAGVSGGIDYRFSEKLIAGVGLGYGRDRTDIGENGTQSRANAYSAAFYGSYKPFDNLFIDALLGGSVLDFNSMRFIATDRDLTGGKRDGSQLFGSLTAAYEFRNEAWLVSPYGRLEMSRSWLQGFAEEGDSIYRLIYGDQTVDNAAGVVGLRANYAFSYEWGKLTPGIRAEYAFDFKDSSRVKMGYAALDGLPYMLDGQDETSGYGNVGLTLDATFSNAWSAGLEYRTGFDEAGVRDHAVSIKIGARF